MQLRKEAWEKKKQYLNGVWTRDLEITGAMLYQLSYEVTDVGSWSIVGSYVPVKDMSVNDIWNKIIIYELRKWNEVQNQQQQRWKVLHLLLTISIL